MYMQRAHTYNTHVKAHKHRKQTKLNSIKPRPWKRHLR